MDESGVGTNCILTLIFSDIRSSEVAVPCLQTQVKSVDQGNAIGLVLTLAPTNLVRQGDNVQSQRTEDLV